MPLYTLDGQGPELPASGRFWIAPDAAVVGKVRLAEDASVWFGCVLRGDNEWISIGARSNVQDSCVMHTDPGFPLDIGDDCTIGHRAILHGCVIGGRSLIGMGATILNGARVGANCLVGANALITEGKVFPDGVLIVGAPARVARTLDAEAIERFGRAAPGYVLNHRRYAAGLAEIKA
jgi:carbonic anhydrase/acetyltransferase-like protein (isoleucine patch superfamily)